MTIKLYSQGINLHIFVEKKQNNLTTTVKKLKFPIHKILQKIQIQQISCIFLQIATIPHFMIHFLPTWNVTFWANFTYT